MKPMDVISKAQAASLMGPYEPTTPEELLTPYESLGDTSEPYDLNEPAAVLELKEALYALGERAADRHRTSDPAIERRWQDIVLGEPSWDGATADEFALAIGRYRGLGWQVPYPYAVSTPGGPQPTATGLELIAGAVNELLGGTPPMLSYERWRAGSFAPPSRISGPDPNDPIIPVSYFGPAFGVEPADTDPDIREQIAAAERMVGDAHAGAMQAGTEDERAKHAANMILGRALRDAWVAEARAQSEVTGEGRQLTLSEAEEACIDLGGRWDGDAKVCAPPPPVDTAATEPPTKHWPLAALGAAAIGAFLLLRERGPARAPSALRGALAPKE